MNKLVIVLGLCWAASVLAAPDDRFLGGSFDGHDRGFLYQYDAATSPQGVSPRFHGGSFDGHDQGSLCQYDPTTSPQGVSPRFHGGSYDGYDRNVFHQYDAATSPQGISPRFHGGSYDGYDGERFLQYASATSPQFIGPRFHGGSYDGHDRDGAEDLTSPLLYDSDNDGLIDWWELGYFSTLNILYGSGDYDEDGADESTEQIADTCPTNPASLFHITQIEETNSFSVTFSCTNSRRYSLQSSEDMVNGAWLMVDDQTNVLGEADGIMFLMATNAPPSGRIGCLS